MEFFSKTELEGSVYRRSSSSCIIHHNTCQLLDNPLLHIVTVFARTIQSNSRCSSFWGVRSVSLGGYIVRTGAACCASLRTLC